MVRMAVRWVIWTGLRTSRHLLCVEGDLLDEGHRVGWGERLSPEPVGNFNLVLNVWALI